MTRQYFHLGGGPLPTGRGARWENSDAGTGSPHSIRQVSPAFRSGDPMPPAEWPVIVSTKCHNADRARSVAERAALALGQEESYMHPHIVELLHILGGDDPQAFLVTEEQLRSQELSFLLQYKLAEVVDAERRTIAITLAGETLLQLSVTPPTSPLTPLIDVNELSVTDTPHASGDDQHSEGEGAEDDVARLLQEIRQMMSDPVTRTRIRERIARVCSKLRVTERPIMRLRYGTGDGHSYTEEEVGHILKTTAERLRRLKEADYKGED